MMKQRYLGRSGMLVSELCLGAMTFGREMDVAGSKKILNRFVEAGGTFIDTADVYSQGVSETILGEWLSAQRRDDLVIATKARFQMSDQHNDIGLSRKHLLSAVENSLRRLKTDYIDLYQVHCWDLGTPLEETLSTLNGIVQSGKVRYIGVSNFKSYQIQKAIDLSRQNGWEAFVSLQPLYNLLDRSIEWELVDLCLEEGLAIIPWSPLRGGWLSGKYSREMKQPPQGTRLGDTETEKNKWGERWSVYNQDRTWRVVETLRDVAKEMGKSPAQVALNWVKSSRGVTAPIIGVRTMEQLNDNIGSTGWEIPPHLRTRLEGVSEMLGPYPYDFHRDVGNSRAH